MTTITEGMTPSQFMTAMNANQAEIRANSRITQFTNLMLGHEVTSAFLLNGLIPSVVGESGRSFINACNTSISISDVVIAGVEDVKTFGAVGNGTTDDSAAIQSAIDAGNIIIQNGVFKVTTSIKIPSNRTIYIKNAKVKRASAMYDNLFRNKDLDTGNVNIKIEGLGGAELDLNLTNINYDNWAEIEPSVYYKVVCILMCQVNGFEISNLYMADFTRWLFRLQNSSNIKIHDCFIDRVAYSLYADFCNTAHCHDLEVYNLGLSCSDDIFNITFGDQSNAGDASYKGFAGWNEGDCYNYHIHDIDVYITHWGGLIVPIGSSDNDCYDILAERIRIRSGGSIFYNSYTKDLFSNDPTKENFHDIVLKDIQIDYMDTSGTHADYPFYFGQDMKDFSATNIVNNSGQTMYVKTGFAQNSTYHAGLADVSDNVKINGVQVT
jgi:hypothetical protein